MKAPAHPGSTSGEEEEPARRRARTHVRAAAPCARTVAGRGPGRERPGGGGRAARVGRSSLSPSAERLARASGQTVAALLCPLGREILGAVESAQCRHPLPAHQDTCPCEAARPTAHYPLAREVKVRDYERSFSKLQWGLETRSGALRCVLAPPRGRVPASRFASGPLPAWGAARA